MNGVLKKIFSDFAANKVTADVGCVHMLRYNARVRLRLLFKRGYFIMYFIHFKAVSLFRHKKGWVHKTTHWMNEALVNKSIWFWQGITVGI